MVFSIKSVVLGLLVASASAAPVELDTRAASSKKGVVYNVASLANAFKGSVSWAYNWDATSDGLDISIQFVPQLHTPSSDVGAIVSAVKGGAKYITGYNEPDMDVAHGGCATQPGAAATSWKTFVGQISGAQIGSPAVTSNNSTTGAIGPSGLVWLSQFIKDVGGPSASKIDFVNLHWYGAQGQSGKAQAGLLETYLKQASAEINGLFGKSMDIWVTEFAALPVTDQTVQSEFLDNILPFLDGFAPVKRYSPFKVGDGQLTVSTASGKAFVNTN